MSFVEEHVIEQNGAVLDLANSVLKECARWSGSSFSSPYWYSFFFVGGPKKK